MLPLLTAAEVRTLDRETEARGVPVSLLMERAGFAVAAAARSLAGGAYGRRAVVLTGKGNNGGDGLVAARHLQRWGGRADVLLLAEPSALGEPSSSKLDELMAAGGTVRPFSAAALARSLAGADVAIDAIFGTGFHGQAEAAPREAIEGLNGADLPLVSVDIPSGVEADTGAVRGSAVSADVTITFGGPKLGAVLLPGARYAGVVQVADIGFPRDLLRAEIGLVEASDVATWWPARTPDSHKRSAGVVLVIGGSRGMTGAPRLVAEGAYRAGAGLVTLAVPEGIAATLQSGAAEATFLPLAEAEDGSASDEGWGAIEEVLAGTHAVAIGPGLSRSLSAAALARHVVTESPVPVVVDADALNAFEGRVADLASRRAPAVLTPHDGELRRLLGMGPKGPIDDRIGAARKVAAEAGAVVLLKGPRTLVASPEGEVRVNATGGPSLATGGTGDVLAGVIAALLGRGLEPFTAASAGAYVHGLAGAIAGSSQGEGVMASDVAAALPAAVRAVREGK